MTRLVIVGLGRQGSRHLRVASRTPGVEVVATVDPFVAGTDLARHFEKVEHALESVEADAAIVATPTHDHGRAVHTLLDGRVPTLVEKPLAAVAEEAAELARAADEAHTVLAVGFVERFNPVVTLLHKMLVTGTLGQPLAASFRRLGLPPAQSSGVDVLHDLAVHDIDVFRLLTGVPSRLVGVNGWPTGGSAESAHLLLEGAGVNGLVQANWRTPVRVRDLTITTDTCFVEANYTTQRVEVVQPHRPTEFVEFEEFQSHYGSARRIDLELRQAEPLAEQLRAFITVVEGGDSSQLADAWAGLEAIRIADQASRRLTHG